MNIERRLTIAHFRRDELQYAVPHAVRKVQFEARLNVIHATIGRVFFGRQVTRPTERYPPFEIARRGIVRIEWQAYAPIGVLKSSAVVDIEGIANGARFQNPAIFCGFDRH